MRNYPSPTEVPELADPYPAQVSILQDHGQSGSGIPDGTGLVNHINAIPEWKEYSVSGTRSDDGDRCLLTGVGCRVQRCLHWGTLVPSEKAISHKLPQTDSRYVCS